MLVMEHYLPLCNSACEDAFHFIAVCPQLHSVCRVFLAFSPPSVSCFFDPQRFYDVVLDQVFLVVFSGSSALWPFFQCPVLWMSPPDDFFKKINIYIT